MVFWIDSSKRENRKLNIVSTMDEIYRDKYDRNDLNYTKENTGYNYITINFDKIFTKNNSEKIDLPKDRAELSYDINSIVASYDNYIFKKSLILIYILIENALVTSLKDANISLVLGHIYLLLL